MFWRLSNTAPMRPFQACENVRQVSGHEEAGGQRRSVQLPSEICQEGRVWLSDLLKGRRVRGQEPDLCSGKPACVHSR